MIPNLINLLSVGAVVSAIFVITRNNPVNSVLFLVAVFLNVAGYLVLYGVPYLGLIYIIVYVGAIAILFLFVIIILDLRLTELREEARTNYTKSLPLTAILGSTFILLIIQSEVVGNSRNIKDIFHLLSPTGLLNSLFYSSQFTIPSHDKMVHETFPGLNRDERLNPFLQIERIGHGLYTHASI